MIIHIIKDDPFLQVTVRASKYLTNFYYSHQHQTFRLSSLQSIRIITISSLGSTILTNCYLQSQTYVLPSFKPQGPRPAHSTLP